MIRVGAQKQTGFTIVELLIVIVVIGILAALVLNNIGTAQVQARNTQTINAAETYKKGLISYATANGAFPTTATFACLGGAYPGGKCVDNVNYATDAAFDTVLKTVIGGSLPMPSITAKPYDGMIFVPASVGDTLDGVPANFIAYYLEGSTTKCPVGPVVSYPGSGVAFTSTPPASGITMTYNGTEAGCWVSLVQT